MNLSAPLETVISDIMITMSLKLTSYKGTRDLYPADMAERDYIFSGWRKVVQGYGYEEYMAPLLEPIDVYAAKSGEEIVNEQTYSFTDRGGRQMVIRPEMTPSVARMVAARRQELPMPARLFSIANFMRYERPQHGREREFWQLNVDLFGVANIWADLEMVCLAYDILRAFRAEDDMFTIRLGDRRLTNYLMTDYLGLDTERTGRTIKLLDRKNKLTDEQFQAQAQEILGDDEAVSKLDRLMTVQSLSDLPDRIKHDQVIEPLTGLLAELKSRGINNARYDITLMRGFDYYTGIVFEIFDEAPQNKRALFGGGRYDGLVEQFGVEPLPVVGFAPGETMFREFLLAHDLMPDFSDQLGATVVILPMSDDECIRRAMVVADRLRAESVRSVAVDATQRKLDKKTKAAIKAGAKWLVYIGEQELADGRVVLKRVATGEQTELELAEAIKAVKNN